MALALCLACGLLAWMAGWVITGQELMRPGGTLARLGVLRHRLKRLLTGLGSCRLVSWLLERDAVRGVVDELRSHAGAGHESLQERDVAALLLLGAAACCVLGAILVRTVAGAFVVFLLELIALRLRVSARAQRDKRALSQEMPQILRTLASALASGNTLVQALDYVGLHEQGLAKEAFVRTSLRLRCGTSMEEALRLLEEELDAPGVGLMATALAISQRTGSPLRELLQQSAHLVEQQGEFDRLLMVRTAQVRLSVRVVCSLPPLMVLLLSLLSTDFRAGLMSAPGLACLVLATLMDALALLAIRHIMAGVAQ
ncbi:MAG: type II secretion system F family protein [Coriobacteriales bacterium]|nr:type II secretion system F family protein [Coriobacteriales bacterium]